MFDFFGPELGTMQNTQNSHGTPLDAIGGDVGRVLNNQGA